MQKKAKQHNPIDQLEKSLNKPILIKIKRNRLYSGILKSFDQHLNLLLHDCVQIYEVEQQKENGEVEIVEEREELGELLIRGDNVVFIEFGQHESEEKE